MTSSMIVGLIIFVVMVALVLLGVPIFVAMTATGFVGFWVLAGPNFALTTYLSAPFTSSASYTYAVMPLFMAMGVMAQRTGIAQNAFKAISVWTHRVKGGLLMATVGANCVFGACSGSSVAGNVIFGRIALPELNRNQYDESFSLGCITASGALAVLIPPSNAIMIYAMLVELSIARALICGVGPGLVMCVLLCIMIAIYVRLFPDKFPKVEKSAPSPSLKEKLSSLKLLIPIVLLFGIIVIGSAVGFFPATVGGAIGAVVVMIYALVSRAIPLKGIYHAIWEACNMIAGTFPIIIAGTIFSRFVTLSGLASGFADLITNLHANRWVVFFIILIFYIFCGMVMDIVAILLITVPITFPLLTSLGFDPYAVCISLCLLCEIAGLTPPVGMNVFAVSNALEIEPGKIFKGVWPFFLVDVVMVILLAAFPQICTFIPSLFNL